METIGESLDNTVADDESPIDEEVDLDQLRPQGNMLNSQHGKEKAAVMRRSVVGRKRPTRQGLRDSLLKSIDESEFPSLLADASLSESREEPEAQATPIKPKRNAGIALPGISPLAMAPKDKKHMDLSNDLANVLKKRHTKKASDEETTLAAQSKPVPIQRKAPTNTQKEPSRVMLDPIASQDLSPPKNKSPIPDVVPRSHQRKLPDLTLNEKEQKPEGMQISPEPRISPRKTELKPIPSKKPPAIHDAKPTMTAQKPLKTVNQSEPLNVDEPPKAPWKPKLRKVETNSSKPQNGAYPVPAPKPVLRPVSTRLSPRDNENVTAIENTTHQSVSIDSLPKKTVAAPTNTSSRPTRLQPINKSSSPDTKNISEVKDKPWQSTLKSTNQDPPLRKPVVSNKPDWIKQAAEKRKRASMIIEQEEQMKNLPVVDEDSAVTPVVMRHNKNSSNSLRTSRSSSIESNSDPAQPPQEVPSWKRELNKQNSRRVIDRYSNIEPGSEDAAANQEKENQAEVPIWRKELRRMSSRGSISSIQEIMPANGEEPGAEPEFIKIFKKRQERLKKSASVELKESEC